MKRKQVQWHGLRHGLKSSATPCKRRRQALIKQACSISRTRAQTSLHTVTYLVHAASLDQALASQGQLRCWGKAMGCALFSSGLGCDPGALGSKASGRILLMRYQALQRRLQSRPYLLPAARHDPRGAR